MPRDISFKKLALRCPSSWEECTDAQLEYVFSLMAADFDIIEVKMLLLFKCSGLKVEARLTRKVGEGVIYLVRQGKDLYEIEPLTFAEIISELDWLDSMPKVPRLLASWGKARPIPANLQGVPFEKYLIIENLFQGYLERKEDSFLEEIADIAYPGRRKGKGPFRSRRQAARLISIFFWVTALKDFLSAQYPNFYRPAAGSEAGNLLVTATSVGARLIDSMNAQIRSLTKGDVTKEEQILQLDTWRALTELNAQAREYEELNRSMQSK